MAKLLSYINANKVYVLYPDGGNQADVQTLEIGDTVEDAKINTDITVAETSNYRKYESSTHNYYTKSGNGYVVESGNEAQNLPKYLTGWNLSDGVTAFTGGGSEVTQQFINQYFSGGATNLDLYAVWNETRFIRVIVSDFGNVEHPAGSYVVAITEASSYDITNFYHLSEYFKRTVDYSNRTNHLILKMNGEVASGTDVGTGDGCPKTVNGMSYPTYFGVKNGTTPSLSLTVSDTSYIPSYTVNGGVVEYTAYVCTAGLSRDFYTKSPNTLSLSRLGNEWTTSIGTINSDETIFIPLKLKPTITAVVCVSGTGKIAITSTTTQPSSFTLETQTVVYWPGEQSVIWAQPSTGYFFNGWYTDCENNILYTTANPYIITAVDDSLTLYAKFGTSEYTITYFKELV